MSDDCVARMAGIEVRYPGLDRPAIAGVNLDIRANEVLAITGPSGSGKSTLLSVTGLLTRASAGTYHLLETNVVGAADHLCARLRAEHLGFVFQAYHLLAHLRVIDNVLLGARYAEPLGVDRRERAQALLTLFGIGDRAAAHPRQLSGGEQQRVAIARALVADPDLVLCDEPTGNLDRGSAERVMGAILAGRDEGRRAIVIVTHDPWVAAQADRVHELEITSP